MTPATDKHDDALIVTPQLLRGWELPQPGSSSDKGERGSIVVIGGSPTTPGAALLAGVAALRAGAGKLAIVTAESVAAPLGVAVPEAAVAGMPTTSGGALDPSALDEIADHAERAQAVLIGPGLTGPEDTKALVAGLLPRLPQDAVVVLDALGLTCGAVDADLLRPRSGKVIVTPNDSEMERLLGRRPGDDLSYGDLARLAAKELGAVVALRGAIASPDGRAWYGQSGHAGLGTSGSGDVLAGLVTGLAGRGAPVEQAAVWGVHLHGEAGERLAARVGRLGFLARELLDEVPGVLTQLEA
jgi:ADP-dependent NAD(P)H-hydrate dehydratase